MHRLLTTKELSKETGVPTSTIKRWIGAGYLTPAVRSLGPGDINRFSEDNVAQVSALAIIVREFGDGAFARRTIEEMVPKITGVTRCLQI